MSNPNMSDEKITFFAIGENDYKAPTKSFPTAESLYDYLDIQEFSETWAIYYVNTVTHQVYFHSFFTP